MLCYGPTVSAGRRCCTAVCRLPTLCSTSACCSLIASSMLPRSLTTYTNVV